MFNKMLLILSCACVMSTCYAQNITAGNIINDKVNATYNCAYDINGRVIYSSAWDKAYEAEWAALAAYENARLTTDKHVANSMYTKAIKNINLAISIAPELAENHLLASQIYRYRGGLSYARNYFSKACKLYEQQLKEYPESITLNLQYAIACYAGDARYYSDYNDYKVRAYLHADKTIKLLDELPVEEKDVLVPKLLAYVILQDYVQAEKIAKRINYVCVKNSLEYTLAEQYRQLTANGKWLWQVSSTENAEKDFLLYYIKEWGI